MDAAPFRLALVEAQQEKLHYERSIWEHRLRHQRADLERREAALRDAERRLKQQQQGTAVATAAAASR